MGLDLTKFDKALKDYYQPTIVETLNNKIPLLDRFKRVGAKAAGGRAMVYPIHVSRNAGRSAIGEGVTLPSAGNQGFIEKRVPFKYNYGRIELTAQAIKMSKSDKGSFTKALTEEVNRASEDVARDMNRQMWGNGSGKLASVDGAHSIGDSEISLTNPGGVVYAGNGARFLAAGDIIAFISADGLTFRQTATVSSVEISTGVVTLTAVLTANLTSGDIVVRAPVTTVTTVAETAYNQEIMGMLGHVDDGSYVSTYHNVDRTAYSVYNSAVRNLSGASLSLDDMQQLMDYIEQLSAANISEFWGHQSARREYISLLESYRRYTNDMARKPDGGYQNAGVDIAYASKPIHADRDCPYGMIFALDTSGFNRYVVEEAKWADDDGKVLLRTLNKDSYEARFRVFDNYTNDTPNKCGVIRGMSVTPSLVPFQ